AVGVGLHDGQTLDRIAGEAAEKAIVVLEGAGADFHPAGASWQRLAQTPFYRGDDGPCFTRAYATTVSDASPSSSTSCDSRSCGTCISQATISSSEAWVKHSSQQPRAPLCWRTGGPKRRQVMGRHA